MLLTAAVPGTSPSCSYLQGSNPSDDLRESRVQQSPHSLAVNSHGKDVLPDLSQSFQLMQHLEGNSSLLPTWYQEKNNQARKLLF